MRDFTAGHISTEEARQLLADGQAELGAGALEFVPGVSYRNLLIYRGNEPRAVFVRDPLHAAARSDGQAVTDDFPRGPGSDLLNELDGAEPGAIRDTSGQPGAAISAGNLPATNVWLWGLGGAPSLPPFRAALRRAGQDDHGGRSAAGLRRADRLGADRGARGDRLHGHRLRGKGQAAIAALETTDLICVHVEAPDEASHAGDSHAKIAALEAIDEQIVAPLARGACGRRVLSHAGQSGPSDAVADEDPQPRVRALGHRRSGVTPDAPRHL